MHSKGGIGVGAFYRTWIRLSQHRKKSATPATTSLQPTSPAEETSRTFQIKEAISGIRLTRVRAKDSVRNGKLNHAAHHLQDQMYYIIQLEAVLFEKGED